LSRGGLCSFRSASPSPYIWDPHTGRTRTSASQGHEKGYYAHALSPDGSTLATGGREGAVILWDAESLDQLFRFDGAHDGVATALAFSPDGRTLVTGGSDRLVRLWDVESRRELASLEGHSGSVGRACFSADGRTLATYVAADGRNEVILWLAVPRGPAPAGGSDLAPVSGPPGNFQYPR
jgi:WD40 repeat protein